MSLKQRIWLLTAGIIAAIVLVDLAIGYRSIEVGIRNELSRDAQDVRALLMATRRVYHQQFLASGLPVDEHTVGFLPAHALSRISKDFPSWSQSGLYFNNVSDQPRNPDNAADRFELEAMDWFRANPRDETRLVEIHDKDGRNYYHFTAPIWVEPYCLKCHGERSAAPPSIAAQYDKAWGYRVGDLRGVMSIKLPTQALREREYTAWLAQFSARLVGYLALLVALGYFLNRYVTRRLAALGAVADRLAAGDYTARSSDRHADEIGGLAAAFSRMGEQIGQRTLALADSEQRFRLISQSLRDALILIDSSDGSVTFWNPAAVRMFGYPAEEMLGRRVHDVIVPPALRDKMALGLAEFARSGNGPCVGQTLELRAMRRDGSEFPVELSISSLQLNDRWMGVGLVRDITERQQATAELEQHRRHLEHLVRERTLELQAAKDIAEAANRAKSTFLANISHEIRTPLNAITGMAYLIRRAGIGDDQAARLDKIQVAGQHLLEIINAVLDISKIDAGRLVLEDSELQLPALLANIASMLGERLQEKGLQMQVDCPPLPFPLRGDPTRLQQALLNYAGNAVKFTERGRIDIRIRVLEEKAESAVLRFEVSDTGIGIAPDVLPRLFAFFEQADASTTRKFGGTGLGLAITRRLAEMMGGSAGANSVPGVGSTFWFTAELKRASSAPTAVASPRGDGAEAELRRHFTGHRVLLVEDDEVNRDVALALLEDAGLAVDTAEDGQQALDQCARHAYELVLMDIQMPVLDGLAATRQLRARPGNAHLPIVALTANAFADDRARCQEAGMDDFIAKPMTPEGFYTTVLHWLRHGRA